MNMSEREKAARAIGYLEGLSSVMWSLDGSDSPVQVCAEAAAFYDEQIEVLRKVLFTEATKDQAKECAKVVSE